MAKRKRQRVPEVIWSLYRNRARTLAETILSFLPSTPLALVDCHCRGRRCLGCSGDNAFSFLVRSNDGTDYRRLLNHCFVVLPDHAPPFSGFDQHNRWSQLEIVRRSIEMTLHEKPTTSNVISSGYDEFRRFSAILELLTTSAWEVLLKRIGDTLMVYLLRNTSIFLPLPQRNHHQVAGFPINDLCPRFSGVWRKRKRIDEVNRIPDKFQRSSSDVNLGSNSINSYEKCSCCLVLHTIPKVIATTQINRRTMFYKVDKSSSVFPKNRILLAFLTFHACLVYNVYFHLLLQKEKLCCYR